MDLLNLDSLTIEEIEQKIQEINKKIVIAWRFPNKNTALNLQIILGKLNEIKNHKILLQKENNSKV